MTMAIKNAFQTTTKKGRNVFRINVDNNEILSHMEQGHTHIAIDIITGQGGLTKIFNGTSKKTGRPYKALMYYVWATKPKEEQKKEVT